MLNENQKRRLMLTYEPVLYFHPAEKFVPVRPEAYIAQSALWRNGSPGTHDKNHWGQGSDTLQGARLPDFFPGELTVRPEEEPEKTLLNEATTDGFTFLETQGWAQLNPGIPLDKEYPDAGAVGLSTRNRDCNIDRLTNFWGIHDPDAELDEVALKYHRDKIRYSAEVHDLSSLRVALKKQGAKAAIDQLDTLANVLGGNPWFIWYYLFYPGHERKLPLPETLATLNKLDVNIPVEASALNEFDTSGIWDSFPEGFGLLNGNYAGDFNAICVIVKGLGSLAEPLLPSNQSLPLPHYVAFGTRTRSVAKDGKYTYLQQMHATRNYLQIGHHPKVYVARGTHNNYPNLDYQRFDPIHTLLKKDYRPLTETDDVDSDTVPTHEKHKTRREILTALAKILTLGPTLGAIASAIEAARDKFIGEPDPVLPINVLFDPLQKELLPDSDSSAFIIAPDIDFPFPDGTRHWREGTLTELGEAVEAVQEDLINGDPNDLPIWLPRGTGADTGYSGDYGPDCVDNPFHMRSGMPFPDFKVPLIDQLMALELEE